MQRCHDVAVLHVLGIVPADAGLQVHQPVLLYLVHHTVCLVDHLSHDNSTRQTTTVHVNYHYTLLLCQYHAQNNNVHYKVSEVLEREPVSMAHVVNQSSRGGNDDISHAIRSPSTKTHQLPLLTMHGLLPGHQRHL